MFSWTTLLMTVERTVQTSREAVVNRALKDAVFPLPEECQLAVWAVSGWALLKWRWREGDLHERLGKVCS